ncbi:hypothetical protein ODZ84_19705 [Chryseobacterium fluminis]|uniref:hypothetical protein n=1 Tax=Chryseobacterium fluminis TaxID=2983606 RepID=UPI00225BF1D5|nr:hypothetical protein [Chryseobacterium sp. MMS21-Ot14]UZT97387.1 hypothetical protein ODZ84_19705 [Chryseobacterium sp. MMS21-Ot14]
MKTERNKYLILNYIFIICLVVLFVNDHFLKAQFSNGLTGKLSDIVGIVILPLLLTYIFPKLKTKSIWISALLFTFWKSPYSQSLIDFYNQLTFIQITRVVDYSDLSVLILLPVPYFLMHTIKEWNTFKIKNIQPFLVLFPTVLVLMSTSPPPSFYYTYSDGNFRCYKCNITVKHTQEEVIEKLRQANMVFDSIYPMSEFTHQRIPGLRSQDIHFYKINTMVIGQDTLRNLDFSMRSISDTKTTIYFNGMDINRTTSHDQLYRKIKKYYKSLILGRISDPLKK